MGEGVCDVETDSEVSFVWVPVGLVPIPDSDPDPVPDVDVCCVVCEDRVLKILLLSSFANCDAPPLPPPEVVLVLAAAAVGLVSFFVDTNMIREKVSLTGRAMHDIMFIISSYADIDFDATPTTLSPREVEVVYRP